MRERITKKSPQSPVGERVYTVEATVHPAAAYPREAQLTFAEISAVFRGTFVPRLKASPWAW